jgi:general secretion pathway protein G
MKKRNSGFTLVELLVVIAILGVLAGTVTIALVKHLDYAKVERAKVDIKNLSSALKMFQIHVGDYPSVSDGLRALLTEPVSVAGQGKWKGPYIEDTSVPKDPWGNEYIYTKPGQENRDFDITSYGKDGAAGGEGVNADITSYDTK